MKGILFNSDNIQAIVEGRKTQARRVIKPQPVCYIPESNINGMFMFGLETNYNSDAPFLMKPRYQVGETVYIKEAIHRFNVEYARYSLDFAPVMFMQSANRFHWRWARDKLSPRSLPREAARYFITFTDVRPERLQEITFDNCLSEGIKYPVTEEGHLVLRLTGAHPPCDYIPKGSFKNGNYAGDKETWLKAHSRFLRRCKVCLQLASAWDSINKAYPWESNPWVWAYSFKFNGSKEVN